MIEFLPTYTSWTRELFDLMTTSSSIIQPGPIKTFAPIVTLVPILDEEAITADGWIIWLSKSYEGFLKSEDSFAKTA